MKELIYGKNVVREAINADKRIFQLYINSNNKEIIELAKVKKLNYELVDGKYLNNLVDGLHQGVVAVVEGYKYYTLMEILADMHQEYPLIIMLDGLEDPHNLGAIIRTCEAAGVDGIIIPKNRSVGLNNTVSKVSTWGFQIFC